MEGMGFEPITCIHGFTIRNSYKLNLRNYRYFNLQRKVYVEHQNLEKYLQIALL